MSQKENPNPAQTAVAHAAAATVVSLLGALQTGGAFASTELQTRQLKLGKDKTADVLVRELPDAEFRKKVGAPYDRSNLIAACIVGEDGQPVLTVEQAAALKVSVARDLERICFEVNGAGEATEEADEKAGKS